MHPIVAAIARTGLAGFLIGVSAAVASAEEPRGIEQALAASQADKRGVTLYVNGQTLAGAVIRFEPGQWVELKGAAGSRIVVRIERIDAVVTP